MQDRAYRLGVFLVVDALVENASLRRVDRAEVSVEVYNFFDELVRMDKAIPVLERGLVLSRTWNIPIWIPLIASTLAWRILFPGVSPKRSRC